MAEIQALSDILSDKPAPKEQAPEVEREAPEAPAEPAQERGERVQSRRSAHRAKEMAAQGRDPDTGQFVSKAEGAEPEVKAAHKVEEKPAAEPEAKAEAKPEAKPELKAEPPKEEMTQKERAAFAAAADERRKRQALEVELAKYRTAAPQQQPAAAPAAAATEKPKTFWDDPEGAFQSFRQEQQNTAMTTKMQTAELIARSRYQDFDEKVAVFRDIVNLPGVAQQWVNAADPAEFAYQVGKRHLELRQAGGIDELRSKIEKETREKVEKEFREKQEKERAERAAIPPSLSQVRGASTSHKEAWQGPPGLDAILKG